MAPALNAELKGLNDLDAVAEGVVDGPMFSEAELTSVIDAADAAIADESLADFDASLSMASDYGTTGAGALQRIW